MFVSIYKYILYKLQRLVAGNYIDDLSAQVAQLHSDKALLERAVEQFEQSVNTLNGACEQYQQQHEAKNRVIVEHSQKLYDAEARLKDLEENPRTAWVMSPDTYKKFCAEFEPPVINHQNTPTDAAFRLGIQRVLSRIGDRYVSR